MKLSEHFTREELGLIDASARDVENFTYLAWKVLEPTRAHFSSPLEIHCGHRTPKHNAAVGGKGNSFHLGDATEKANDDGHAAVDCHIADVGIAQLFDWLRAVSGLPFDKVILETDQHGNPLCVHIQTDRLKPPRREAYIGEVGACTRYKQVEVGPAVTDQDISA